MHVSCRCSRNLPCSRCRYLLREDMYRQAVGFLPALRQDMGSLCSSEVVEEEGGSVTTLTVARCMYHELLTQASTMLLAFHKALHLPPQGHRDAARIGTHVQEDAPFLLSEFCCHHGLLWMHDFRWVTCGDCCYRLLSKPSPRRIWTCDCVGGTTSWSHWTNAWRGTTSAASSG